MSSTCECENHACAKACASDHHFTCSLCKEPVYCSEQCQMIDWPLHACANLIEVPTENCGAFVPYYYEDLLTEAELAEVPLNDPIYASYSTVHYNPNRTITTSVIPSLVEGPAISDARGPQPVRGGDPTEALADYEKFAISIQLYSREGEMVGTPKMVIGTIPDDMIYEKNKSNKKAKQLASTFRRAVFSGDAGQGRFVFWPPTDQIIGAQIRVPLAGGIGVKLEMSDASKPLIITAQYSITPSRRGATSSLSRKVTSLFQSQNRIKFGDMKNMLPVNGIHVVRYEDNLGNSVVLSFAIYPGNDTEAHLIDVEFVAQSLRLFDKRTTPATPNPNIKHPIGKQTRFTCDPLSLDDVVGLSMAVEYALSGDELGENRAALERAAGTLQEYAHQMIDNDGHAPESVPVEVSTAIGFALDSLYEPVGVAFGVDKYTTKLARASTPADIYKIFNPIIDKMRDTMAKARNDALTGKGLRKAKGKAQKSITIRDARNLLVALSTKQQTTTITEETRNALNTLIIRLNTDVLQP